MHTMHLKLLQIKFFLQSRRHLQFVYFPYKQDRKQNISIKIELAQEVK